MKRKFIHMTLNQLFVIAVQAKGENNCVVDAVVVLVVVAVVVALAM